MRGYPSTGDPRMSEEYADGTVECAADGLRLRGYYFPWGMKHIPYSSIRGVQRVDIGAFTGRARIWGTSNPRYWANFDPRRPKKTVGLVLDIGKSVKPFITSDDPDVAKQSSGSVQSSEPRVPPAVLSFCRSPTSRTCPWFWATLACVAG